MVAYMKYKGIDLTGYAKEKSELIDKVNTGVLYFYVFVAVWIIVAVLLEAITPQEVVKTWIRGIKYCLDLQQ